MTAPITVKSDGSKSIKVSSTGAGDRRDGKSTKANGSSKSFKTIGEIIHKSKSGKPKQSHDVTADQDQDHLLFSPPTTSNAFIYSGKASKSEKVANQSTHNFMAPSIPVSVELPSDNVSGHSTLSPSSVPSMQPSGLPTAVSTEASTPATTVAPTVISTVKSTSESTERPTLGLFLFGAKTSKFGKEDGDEYQ